MIPMQLKIMGGNPLTTTPLQVELVTLAVYLLGGDQHPVDTEDIAVKVHELAPTRFSWRKYPEQINLELIRVYLSDGKKPDKGGFLDGSGKTGWSLTAKGVNWVKTSGLQLIGGSLDRPREETGGGSVDEQRWRRERQRVITTRAWSQWSSGVRDISVRDAEEVFRIDSYAVGRMRTLKVTRLRKLFEQDKDISEFLHHMSGIVEMDGGG